MQITVFGASGKVGRLVVDQLVASGHTVIAFIHESNPFEGLAGVRTVKGSVTDKDVVRQAVLGSDAVVSALGSWGSHNKRIVSSGTKSIVEAMTTLRIKRLVTLTGASAFYSLDKPNLMSRLTRKFLELIAADIVRDGENHLTCLESSGLDWTCVRSPVMTPSSSSTYHLSKKLPTILAFVPRQAVAKCLVDQISETSNIRRAPVIYRG